jgi:hypothetical protein
MINNQDKSFALSKCNQCKGNTFYGINYRWQDDIAFYTLQKPATDIPAIAGIYFFLNHFTPCL